MATDESYPYVIVKCPIIDLVPLCWYNNLHHSEKALHYISNAAVEPKSISVRALTSDEEALCQPVYPKSVQ